MRTTAISVAEAARNFVNYVNRVHHRNLTFVLLENGSSVARLVPDAEKVCLGRDLAAALGRAKLPADEARAWRRDLRAARKALKAPTNRWR
jgi:antitoxin (DNA-binding transcriptional repressor) of toxin-antitoxin stability system